MPSDKDIKVCAEEVLANRTNSHVQAATKLAVWVLAHLKNRPQSKARRTTKEEAWASSPHKKALDAAVAKLVADGTAALKAMLEEEARRPRLKPAVRKWRDWLTERVDGVMYLSDINDLAEQLAVSIAEDNSSDAVPFANADAPTFEEAVAEVIAATRGVSEWRNSVRAHAGNNLALHRWRAAVKMLDKWAPIKPSTWDIDVRLESVAHAIDELRKDAPEGATRHDALTDAINTVRSFQTDGNQVRANQPARDRDD